MKLDELFDEQHDWEWLDKRSDAWKAHFAADDGSAILVHFERTDVDERSRGVWQADFERSGTDDPLGITGQGNASTILGTVGDIIKDFQRNVRAKALVFHADEPSRQRLYRRLVPKLGQLVGMRPHQYNPEGEPGEFWLIA